MKKPDIGPSILFAEDEKNLAKGVLYNLETRGYQVTHVERGDQAFELASNEAFDLILLDLMLPGKDGLSICNDLRSAEILTPILMLTAMGDTNHRVEGLNAGADDYLPKPFELEELFARIQALLRRRNWDSSPTTTRLGPIDLDSNRLLLKNTDGRVAQLTAIELKLLRLLIAEKNKTLSRSEILKKVWGFSEGTQTRTLDNFIMRLRYHLESVGGNPDWIESVRGVGYRLEVL